MSIREEFLLVKEAAAMLGVCPNTIRAWGASGQLTEYRHPVNHYRMFKRKDIDQLLKPQRQTSSRQTNAAYALMTATQSEFGPALRCDSAIKMPRTVLNRRVQIAFAQHSILHFGHSRVSSDEQEKEGFSIPAQQKLMKKYAAENGISVVEEYIDVETAKAAGRTCSYNWRTVPVSLLPSSRRVRNAAYWILCSRTARGLTAF